MEKPRFPLRIRTSDGEEELVANQDELAMALEWFDSERSDGSVQVIDADGLPVTVKIDALRVKALEDALPSKAPPDDGGGDGPE